MQRLTDDQVEQVVDMALSFYQGERIDWEDLIDRAESSLDIDFGCDMTDPEIRRLKRYVNKARKEVDQ